eukprot:m.482435 g.482435  ORF g.482435 m.482435 type:complete len:818 (+) comp22546_c0_seq1:212-2665(+)
MDARVPVSTRSIEQVLSPIAEQVSQLIVLDQRAQQNKTPIPDLTAAAEAIGMATRSLVLAGRESMPGSDAELQSQMPPACEQVQAAGKLFMDATVQLKADPYSSKARSHLVEAARGILAGTTNILIAFDAYEVRKIALLADSVTAQLVKVKGVRTLEDLVSSVRTLSEAMIALAQLADARHEELMNASLRSRLLIANETLRKSSPLLVTALRTYVQNPGNTQAEASRDYSIDQLLGAAKEIVQVVTSSDLDDLTYEEHPGELATLVDSVTTQLLGGATYKPQEVQTMVEQVLSESAVIANTCSHEPCVERIGEMEEAIRVKLDALMAASSGPESNKRADELREGLEAMNEQLKEAAIRNVSEAFVEATALEVLVAQARDGCSQQQLQVHMSEFSHHTKLLCESACQVASLAMDTKRVRMVQATVRQLQETSEQILNSTKIVHQQPESKVAQEHLTLLTSNWEHRVEVLKATVHGMTDAGTMITVSGEVVRRDMAKAQVAAQAGDREGTLALTQAVQRRLDHINVVATNEVENSEDAEFRAPAEASALALAAAVPKFVESARAVSDRPEDRSAAADLSRNVKAVNGAVRSVQKAVAPPSVAFSSYEEVTPPEPQQASSDGYGFGPPISLAEVITAAPVNDTPIAVAAANLRRETMKFSDQTNPLIVVASEMAKHMEIMSEIARVSSNSLEAAAGDIIETSKAIADNGNLAVRYARETAQTCSDKRLRADLLYICDRIPTISTQLKIIASVKAASRSQDTAETDAMLVKNAQNLMDAVTRAVKACEIASLKRFGAAADVAAVAMRWRKRAKRPLTMAVD